MTKLILFFTNHIKQLIITIVNVIELNEKHGNIDCIFFSI